MDCAYCKREMKSRSVLRFGRLTGLERTRDHYIPLSRGGTNAKENIRLACYCCNNRKGDMMPDDWERYMRDHPLWWTIQVNVRRDIGIPLAVKAPMSDLRSMTAAENARRIKAYLEKNVPVRPLRKDEPVPVEFEDPGQQAAFEAYAMKYRHMLRVPQSDAAGQPPR